MISIVDTSTRNIVNLFVACGSLRQLFKEKTVNKSFVSVDFVPSCAAEESDTMSKRWYFWYFCIGKWSELEKNDARSVWINFPSLQETSVIFGGDLHIWTDTSVFRVAKLCTGNIDCQLILCGFLGRIQVHSSRASLASTTVLTIWMCMVITLMGSVNSQLIKVSNIKALDVYFGMCFFYIFDALIKFAAVCYCEKSETEKADDEKRRGKGRLKSQGLWLTWLKIKIRNFFANRRLSKSMRFLLRNLSPQEVVTSNSFAIFVTGRLLQNFLFLSSFCWWFFPLSIWSPPKKSWVEEFLGWRQVSENYVLLWPFFGSSRILYGKLQEFLTISLSLGCWWIFERLQSSKASQRISVKLVHFVVFSQLVVCPEDCLQQVFEQFNFSDFLSEVGILDVSQSSSLEILLTF